MIYFYSGYVRSENNATIGYSRKKIQIEGGDHPQKETMNLYSHAGRAKPCKKDSRYPPLCTKREEHRQESQHNSSEEKKEKPEIQVQRLKFDKISEGYMGDTDLGIMLLQARNSLFRRTIF